MKFCYNASLAFLNNRKDVDSSYKTYLDFWDRFGRKKLCLPTEEIRYGYISLFFLGCLCVCFFWVFFWGGGGGGGVDQFSKEDNNCHYTMLVSLGDKKPFL